MIVSSENDVIAKHSNSFTGCLLFLCIWSLWLKVLTYKKQEMATNVHKMLNINCYFNWSIIFKYTCCISYSSVRHIESLLFETLAKCHICTNFLFEIQRFMQVCNSFKFSLAGKVVTFPQKTHIKMFKWSKINTRSNLKSAGSRKGHRMEKENFLLFEKL